MKKIAGERKNLTGKKQENKTNKKGGRTHFEKMSLRLNGKAEIIGRTTRAQGKGMASTYN